MSLKAPCPHLQLSEGLDECSGLLEGDESLRMEKVRAPPTKKGGSQELQVGMRREAGLSVDDHDEYQDEGEREGTKLFWEDIEIIQLFSDPILVCFRKTFSLLSLLSSPSGSMLFLLQLSK